MGDNRREVKTDLFALKIWWNLNILRDTLKGGEQPNLVLFSPAGVSRAYASSLSRYSSGVLGSLRLRRSLSALA
jgi:hypothetical protein